MRITFVPTPLAEKWDFASHVACAGADSITPELFHDADIVIASAKALPDIFPKNWPGSRLVVDAAENTVPPPSVRNWFLSGVRTVVLDPSERTPAFIGLDVSDWEAGSHGIVGNSEKMQALKELIEKVAGTSATVLIRGESGTGKELVARAIHRLSRRKHHAFVAVNCAAIPEPLLEDDLFGHVKGAFTDAVTNRRGKLEEANGGTLFLDEIGDMPHALQVKLLRVIQEKEIQPLGSNRPKKVDVRIIAATAANLEEMIREKTFREDLYFRLNVIPILVPSLRERVEDIPDLIEYFSNRFGKKHGIPTAKFSKEAMKALIRYPWQGNVRELENFVERTMVLSNGDSPLGIKDLPLSMGSGEKK